MLYRILHLRTPDWSNSMTSLTSITTVVRFCYVHPSLCKQFFSRFACVFVKLGYQTIENLGGNQHLLFKLGYPPPPKLNSSHLKSYRAPIGKDRLPTTILQGLCYETSGGPNHLPQLRQLGSPFFMEVDEDFERDVTNAVAQFLQAYWDS